MKLQSIFTFAMLMIYTLSQETTTGCLSADNLKKIGFTTIKETAEKIESPTYCKDVFAEQGACVAEEEVKAVVESQQDKFTNFNQSVASIFDTFDSFFGAIGESLSNLYDSVTGSDEKKEPTWKEQMVKSVKKAKETSNECYIFYNTLQHGTTCLVASGLAKQYVTETDATWKLTSNPNALELVSKCMDVSSTVCLFFKGGAEANLTSAQSDNQKALCEKINEYEGCIQEGGTDTVCLTDAKKEEIFKLMYNPYGNKWLPSVADIESMKEKIVSFFESVKDKIFSWTKNTEEANQNTESNSTARMLQEESSSTSSVETEYSFNAEGYDYKKGGDNSGIEKKFSARYSVFMIAIITLLLNKF